MERDINNAEGFKDQHLISPCVIDISVDFM